MRMGVWILVLGLLFGPSPTLRAGETENQRAWFLAGQTLLALGIYSWGVPVSLGLSDNTAVGVGLLTPPGWFGLSLLRSAHPVSGGEAYGAFVGGITGFFHGVYLMDEIRWGTPVSMVENFLDQGLARKNRLRASDMQRKVNRSIFGFYHFAALHFLLGGKEFGAREARWAAGLSLLEAYVPLLAQGPAPWATFGDALMELRYGVLGAEALPALLLTLDLLGDGNIDINKRVYWGASLAGHLVALPWSRAMSLRYDLSLGGAVASYLVPALAHGFTAGVGVLLQREGYWRAYPALFFLTDTALTLFLHHTFGS